MGEQQWAAVDRFVTDALGADDAALTAAVAAGEEAGLPQIQVSPAQGRLLQLLAVAVGARRVLEIGTLAGYSAIHLARALPADGLLVTLEADPRHAEVARANLARAGLADRVEVRLGPAQQTLPELVADGKPFDLIFIDADKTGYPDYLGLALQLSRPGTLIVADNVVRDGAVADPDSTDASALAVRRFTELIGEHRELTATVLQTVGAKGWDGLAFAVVGQ